MELQMFSCTLSICVKDNKMSSYIAFNTQVDVM